MTLSQRVGIIRKATGVGKVEKAEPILKEEGKFDQKARSRGYLRGKASMKQTAEWRKVRRDRMA